MNLPNYITLGRICLAPLVVVFLISTESIHSLVAAIIFGAAALTDWLDGLLARRRRENGPAFYAAKPFLRGRECTSHMTRARKTS